MVMLSQQWGWKPPPALFALLGTGLSVVAYLNTAGINESPYPLAKWILMVTALWGASLTVVAYRRAQFKAKESLSRFRTLFDTTVDGMIIIDEFGIVEEYNNACEKLFGYRCQEVVGQNVKMLMPSPYRESHDDYLKRYRETKQARIIGIGREVEGRRKDGSTFPMELSVGETMQNEKQFFVGIIRDVTTRRSAEAALLSAKAQAESANQAKSLFLANMSHEIRTPMNAILGYAQLLDNDPGMSSHYRQNIRAIANAGNHLLELINDMLDISKIEAGAERLEPEDFWLPAMIERISDIFRVRCNQKQLYWQVKSQINQSSVRGDQRKLRQVLINLLSNAIKFTNRGKVTLSVTQSGPHYYFEVSDTGVGIEVEMQEKIFEPFQQAEGGLSKGGTGLGLAIAKRQIELLGGKLQLESQLGKGSRFFFTLTLHEADPKQPAEEEKEAQPTSLAPGYKLTAYVVDDVADNREILAGILRALGAEVRTAADGQQALRELQQSLADIVFIDVRMPVMDGVETVRHIRQRWTSQTVPCVAVSASNIVPHKQYYLDAGFDDFIMKPFKVHQLTECLEKLLQVKFSRTSASTSDSVESTAEFSELVLPEELVQRLRHAVDRNAFTDIESLLGELRGLDPRAYQFADYMQHFLDRYDRQGMRMALGLLDRG
jgi:PAS domain S-box-containing protein